MVWKVKYFGQTNYDELRREKKHWTFTQHRDDNDPLLLHLMSVWYDLTTILKLTNANQPSIHPKWHIHQDRPRISTQLSFKINKQNKWLIRALCFDLFYGEQARARAHLNVLFWWVNAFSCVVISLAYDITEHVILILFARKHYNCRF